MMVSHDLVKELEEWFAKRDISPQLAMLVMGALCQKYEDYLYKRSTDDLHPR